MEEKIRTFLQAQIPQARDLSIRDLRKGSYGASMETFLFTGQWKEADLEVAREFVLRRSPVAGLLASDRQREYRVLRAIEGSAVLSPRTYGFCGDPSVLERPFFIMEKKPGFVSPSFQRFGSGNEELRTRIGKEVVRALAAIHRLDWKHREMEFLGVPAEGRAHALSEIGKWKAILEEAELAPEPILTLALQWLEENAPSRSHTCLLHGDFKMDNILYSTETVEAVLDWEMAAIGDPMQDLGWFCMHYYAVDGLLNGILEPEEFFRLYEDASGIPVSRESVHFWQVLSDVKMAAISLTGIRGYCEGRIATNVMAILGILLPRLLASITRLLKF